MHDDFRAADTCCALPSNARATRYLLLNRCLPRPQGDPRLSVSCVTARERGWRRRGSLATRGRTSLARAWLASTHTPLLLNYCLQGAGGGDTKTNLTRGDMAVQKRHGWSSRRRALILYRLVPGSWGEGPGVLRAQTLGWARGRKRRMQAGLRSQNERSGAGSRSARSGGLRRFWRGLAGATHGAKRPGVPSGRTDVARLRGWVARSAKQRHAGGSPLPRAGCGGARGLASGAVLAQRRAQDEPAVECYPRALPAE